MNEASRTSTIYSVKDHDAINRQINKRWRIIAIPCIILLVVLVWSLTARIEWVTTVSTILL